jgi:hypothetical protein
MNNVRNVQQGKRHTGLPFLLIIHCSLLIIHLFCLNACASTGPRPGFAAGDFPRPSYNTEDINGSFPEAIYIKTRTQSFNTYHYYLLHKGFIWYKSIAPENEPKDWTLFEKTGLPHNKRKPSFNGTNAIVEISADADELVALSEEGGFYRYCFDSTIAHPSKVWLDRQGWPNEEQLYLDRRTAGNRAWAIGKRNSHVLYYEDPFGNQHHNGTMEIATTYVLLEDGQEICYTDAGLPGDFSRNYLGPERGAFKALSLSASASTMFVINEAGVMYTRMADFDIIGCDPMWFKYTYVPYTSDLAGSNYFSNLTEWALPPEDWRIQPSIPLSGKAGITRHITILQNGQGHAARELRVAGRNEDGEIGYWTKAIFADPWEFKTAPLALKEDDFLRLSGGDDVDEGRHGKRGDSPDKNYRGYWWTGGERENGFMYEIPNFNILEGSCDFRILFRNETCVLKLHPVEMWTYLKRDYIPGRIGPPKLFLVTLAIPEDAFAGLSEDFIRRIKDKFAKYDRALFKYSMAASSRFIILRNQDEVSPEEQESALFLTDGTLSDYFPEFRRTWYIANDEAMSRYVSPELIFTASSAGPDGQAAPGDELDELSRKIALNKTFLAELKNKIRGLRNNKAAAVMLDMIYLPLHYTVRFTPLRFIDAPKIRTMTNYGEKIVLANSFYTDRVSDTRIWVYQKIIALLELRITCYEETAKQLLEGMSQVSIPAWYSDTVTGYWDIAGLPHRITGNFSSPNGNIPATLQFHTGEENGELLGWYLSINGNTSLALFLDPKKSAETIYSRQGKGPEQRGVKINCTLYVHPGRTSAPERNIIENSIGQFNRTDQQGIDIAITFDGENFEMRESPPRHGDPLIFRGQRTAW